MSSDDQRGRMNMSVSMSKSFHQCQRGRLLDNWFGQLVFIDVNPGRVILEIDANPWKIIESIEMWMISLDNWLSYV
jgi:hypothetical protein